VHHLWWTDEDLEGFNRDLKLNQPLRTGEDRHALREAALSGTLDVVVSDHRPRTPEEHDADFVVVAPGIAGLHAVGPVLCGALKDHGASDDDVATAMSRLLSTGPRRVLGAEMTPEDTLESITLFSPTSGVLKSSSKAPNTVYTESTKGISGRVLGVLTERGVHWN
jgi:dihydroorotase